MKRPGKTSFRLLSPLLMLFCTFSLHTHAWARSADNNAPVHIEADQMEMREKEDISIYTGDVKITKGSIKITGDRIYIQNKNGALHSIKIDGSPATFYQLNDLNEAISAQSHKMEYLANEGKLELKKNAVLEKNKNRFSSEHIVYDTLKDVVRAGQADAGSSQNGSPNNTQPPRVKITIHPDKKPAQKKPAENTAPAS
ncbi:MAG TPA: lipopolysaccharide transport periplasmic protein LptA [Gammaproteobacteria bacterium]|nr:lipopolysaccharide transport periplasmic protein LptA [Gammaproteobacteria bacterium]